MQPDIPGTVAVKGAHEEGGGLVSNSLDGLGVAANIEEITTCWQAQTTSGSSESSTAFAVALAPAKRSPSAPILQLDR